MRLVFDTNVYILAFVIPGSKADLAFRLAVRGAFGLAVSAEILTEVREKLDSKFGFSKGRGRARRADNFRLRNVRGAPETELHVLENEQDNRILECAVAAGASAIVTGDRHLLALGSYEGVGIMTVPGLLYSFPGWAAASGPGIGLLLSSRSSTYRPGLTGSSSSSRGRWPRLRLRGR